MSCCIAFAHSNTAFFTAYFCILALVISTSACELLTHFPINHIQSHIQRKMSDSSCHSLALPTLMRYQHHVNSFRDAALKKKNTMQINTGNYSMFHHRHRCMTMSDNHNTDECFHNGAQCALLLLHKQ